MQKTYCDRCGAECDNKICRIEGHVHHFTSGRDKMLVGEDEIKPVELCGHCEDAFAQFLGPSFRLNEYGSVKSQPVPEGPYTEDGRAPEMAYDPHP